MKIGPFNSTRASFKLLIASSVFTKIIHCNHTGWMHTLNIQDIKYIPRFWHKHIPPINIRTTDTYYAFLLFSIGRRMNFISRVKVPSDLCIRVGVLDYDRSKHWSLVGWLSCCGSACLIWQSLAFQSACLFYRLPLWLHHTTISIAWPVLFWLTVR